MNIDINNIALSLYVHIPWCVQKCPYCDFNSHTLPKNADFAGYVQALLADARAQAPLCQGRQISSIFIGGGTPSVLPITFLAQLMHGLRNIFDLTKDCEITLEANPGTTLESVFEDYLSLNINRLSIGAQSFCDDNLQKLGRIHNADAAKQAIIAAKMAGFLRINVDVMHGLMHQSVDNALYDVSCAIDFGASHISWYELTIEPNTAFAKQKIMLPDECVLSDIERCGQQKLTQAEFINYETSAWVSTHDSPCRHNLNYWTFGDYLAIGAGAHAKITIGNDFARRHHQDLPKSAGIYRFYKSRMPKDYTQAPKKMLQFSAIKDKDLPFEYMLNALRLKYGTSMQNFCNRTGLDINSIQKTLDLLKQKKLLYDNDTHIMPTDTGFMHANYLMRAFLH